MALTRRQLLACALAGLLPLPAWAAREREFVACAQDDSGAFLTSSAGPRIALATRGHSIMPVPASADVITVARRAGYWMARFNRHSGEVVARTAASANRHFYGHALLSRDGKLVYTSENDIARGRGVIGVYDAATLTRLREFDSGGIGPHELIWGADGALWVANGGILTLPESGRAKLNLATMAPSLVRLDAARGEALETATLADPTLSLRHLARSRDGTIAVAIQAESPDGRDVSDSPLLALYRDGRLTLAEVQPGWAGYAASVATAGDLVIATALYGNLVLVWDSRGRLLAEVGYHRPAGIAVDGSEVFVSNELGTIALLDLAAKKLTPLFTRSGVSWDNHLALA
ncbi:DUF1513 domain-containing protein [Chitinibacteraceae bacterium HSL-7]